jgi:hypothetical protein
MEGATVESVCAELNRLDDAIASGKGKPFSFNDSYRSVRARKDCE